MENEGGETCGIDDKEFDVEVGSETSKRLV